MKTPKLNFEQFKKDLEALINKHSMENGSDTPDFMIADYLCKCLIAYNKTIEQRERWYGRDQKEVGCEHNSVSTNTATIGASVSETIALCDDLDELTAENDLYKRTAELLATKLNKAITGEYCDCECNMKDMCSITPCENLQFEHALEQARKEAVK